MGRNTLLNIVAVQTGNYCRYGAKYVSELFNGIWDHLACVADCKLWCLTDDPLTLPFDVKAIEPEPGLQGWWNKLSLFKPGLFKGQVLYFDLDTMIVGDISGFANYQGDFAALRDPYFHAQTCSAIMAWEAGVMDHVYIEWQAMGRPRMDPRGDQQFIGMIHPKADYWQDFLPGQAVSFKADCMPLGHVPEDARVIYFHGRPKPHEIGFSQLMRFPRQAHVACAGEMTERVSPAGPITEMW